MTSTRTRQADDKGDTRPVVPTDAPPAPPVGTTDPRIKMLEAELAEKDRQIDALETELASRPDSQGNFPSARVMAHEDQRDAAIIARWESETGQTWNPEEG